MERGKKKIPTRKVVVETKSLLLPPANRDTIFHPKRNVLLSTTFLRSPDILPNVCVNNASMNLYFHSMRCFYNFSEWVRLPFYKLSAVVSWWLALESDWGIFFSLYTIIFFVVVFASWRFKKLQKTQFQSVIVLSHSWNIYIFQFKIIFIWFRIIFFRRVLNSTSVLCYKMF